MLYTVRRLGDPRNSLDLDIRIYDHEARDHRMAAVVSGLAKPGARLIVEGRDTIVRFHVDARGRIVEQSRYSTERG